MTQCRCCQQHSADTRLLCTACTSRLDGQLLELPTLHRDLAHELIPSPIPGQLVSGSKVPPMPCRADALTLRAAGGIPTVMTAWAELIFDARGFPAPNWLVEDRVQHACDLIGGQLEWAARWLPGVDQLMVDVDQLHLAATAVLVPPEPTIRIGRCPVTPVGQPRCTGILVSRGPDVHCPACRTAWAPGEWRLLGRVLAELDDDPDPEPCAPALGLALAGAA